MENVANIVAECYRLNSVQMRHLLRQYECEGNEAKPTPQFINCVSEVCFQSFDIRILKNSQLAAAQVDSILTANDEPIELETERDYNQSFIVPSDGVFINQSTINQSLRLPLRILDRTPLTSSHVHRPPCQQQRLSSSTPPTAVERQMDSLLPDEGVQ